MTRRTQYVAFRPRRGRTYALYLGNPEAERPDYDIVRYVGRLRAEGVQSASLGAVAPNRAYRSEEQEVPWSERHRAILWLALLAVLVVLVVLVGRQARQAAARADTDDPSQPG